MINHYRILLLLVFFMPTTVFCSDIYASKKKAEQWNTRQSSHFTENKGQVADQNGNLRKDVKYIYATPGMKVIFKANSFSYEVHTIEKNPNPRQISEATEPINELLPEKCKEPEEITIKTHRIDITLPGANSNPHILAEEKRLEYNNYYFAHTPENGVKAFNYNKLTYKDVWPNIDLVFYAKKEGELKYDIVLHPGADMKDIQFAYTGANNMKLENGKVNIATTLGNIEERIPLSYIAENKEKVNISYRQRGKSIEFSGNYDKSKTLIIDPTLRWATYYGVLMKNIMKILLLIQSEIYIW